MKHFIALALVAGAYAPTTAHAGWNTTSYNATFEAMRDIRNTLTRWCSLRAADVLRSPLDTLEDGCGRYLDGKELQGVPVFFQRKIDRDNLATLSRWMFVFDYDAAAYTVSIIDEVQHQSEIRDASTDETRSYMEVTRIDKRLASANPAASREFLTFGTAWRGYRTGNRPKDERQPPAINDYERGLGQVIRDIYDLRFRVKEQFRTN